MRGQHHDVQDLTRLSGLSGDELRVAFRRGFANLAAKSAGRPLPLEGLDPEQLLASVRTIFTNGLLDDLSWLSPPNGATVLYELAAALPSSEERNLLNQMVVERLANADAATFVSLAIALAQSSRTGFTSARMRSRVSLVLSLPMGAGMNVDALALALILQPDLAREWVKKPSEGSLPSRRLAARLLERAAREAARRWAYRDDAGVRALESSDIKKAWDQLLADRESLVWRHVAVARGLLSHCVPAYQDEIQRSLNPELSPTEWRRGAASLAASIAVMPKTALGHCTTVLRSEITKRDPGVAASMMTGLLRAAEAEPTAAEGLIVPLLRAGGVQAAEAFLELRAESGDGELGRDAVAVVTAYLRDQLGNPDIAADDGAVGLIEWLLNGFDADKGGSLDSHVKRAVHAFVTKGAPAALRFADEALGQALSTVARLEKMSSDSREGRMATFRSLQEIDVALLQASTLADLVALGDDQDESAAELNELFDKLTALLMASEPVPSSGHPTLRMRRVRALLHVVDADGSYGDQWTAARRPRRLRAVRLLLTRARQEASSPLRRAILACLARVFDALVREEVFELSDVILCASLYLTEPNDIATLAEASMVPELSSALDALGNLADRTVRVADSDTVRKESLSALSALVAALPAAHSPRVSLLRSSLLRVQLVLNALRGVRSLSDLVDTSGGGNTIDDLSDALQALAQLVAGTRRRLAPSAQVKVPEAGAVADRLGAAFEHVVQVRKPDQLTDPLAELEECLSAELSPPFYTMVMRALSALKTLPILAPVAGKKHGTLKRVTSPGMEERGLPAWLPPNRMLGGFYVLHAIGEGGVGSVFVARRAEERDDADAEVFALKVPEYDGDVSQLLSEADFLRMFREEAGALLALPDNAENLARFVTFDAGVKPKPILVMEHVEGPSLEKLLSRRHLDVGQAFDILEGLSRGLSAMHATGIAHLDVKPSNVILRDFWNGALMPVLVDFGLSGRRLRPGCGTANYAAPEIWGAIAYDDPRPADVYAFGCLAYELLAGATLFDAPSDVAIVAQHVSHDGVPEGVQAMHAGPELRALGEWLTACLRHNPAQRAPLAHVAEQIPALREAYETHHWPLAPRAAKAVASGAPARSSGSGVR
jgi:hypothetical protein